MVVAAVERWLDTPKSFGDRNSAPFKFKDNFSLLEAMKKSLSLKSIITGVLDFLNDQHAKEINHLHKAIKDGNTDATNDVYKCYYCFSWLKHFPTGRQERHNLYCFSAPPHALLNLNNSRVGEVEHVSYFIVFLRFKHIEM